MKLIKITEEHYVIVDDLQIEEGDWYIDDTLQILQALPSKKDWINSGKSAYIICEKITHSTVPKGFMLLEGVNRLSLQEVKELIGEVDVKIKGQKYSTTHEDVSDKLGKYLVSACFQDGYYTALEDNKDKKYTEEDMINLFESTKQGKIRLSDKQINLPTIMDYIQSLQLKTEWEVEIVDAKLKLK